MLNFFARCTLFASACALFTASVICRAGENDWAEHAATRDYYNYYGKLEWRGSLADWADADGQNQGSLPFATATVSDTDSLKVVQWDITNLARLWLSGTHPNQGLVLRPVSGGLVLFYSREHSNVAERPELIVTTQSSTRTLSPVADTFIEPSTYHPQGEGTTIKAGQSRPSLLRFDLREFDDDTEIVSAVLGLHSYTQYGDSTIGVFRSNPSHHVENPVVLAGIASRYPGDQNIVSDPDVVFATGFESDPWESEWSYSDEGAQATTPVTSDSAQEFQPLFGRALRVYIAAGANVGMNTAYKFADETGSQPEQMYFRYYVRIGATTQSTLGGGKFPGFSGTYGAGGWGGRTSDGTNGWSARGQMFNTAPADNPLADRLSVGSYVYHAGQAGTYGDQSAWNRDYRGMLKRNRWYSVEQYLAMNTPGVPDGTIRAWVDGVLAFEKTDFRFRDVSRLKIEQVWMNFYHGGEEPAPEAMYFYIDNIVIARRYIGPISGAGTPLDEAAPTALQ